MIARYLLVLALVALSLRGLYQMYVEVIRKPYIASQLVERPSNRRISYESRNISVGTARSKSRSSISAQRNAAQSQNTSYASYRSKNRRAR